MQVLGSEPCIPVDLTDNLLDGQVTIDADAEVTRSLTLQLTRPETEYSRSTQRSG